MKINAAMSLFLAMVSTSLCAQNSVLSNGDWYKLELSDEGIYQLTYQDMISMGVNPESFTSSNFSIYGNGGGMLSEVIDDPRPVDLEEIAIEMVDGGDGTFDQGDYLLFYGQSPHRWNWDGDKFDHQTNIYSDETYYFLTTSSVSGKRIELKDSSLLTATHVIDTYDEHLFHESEQVNLIKSGKPWYGEYFSSQNTIEDFKFQSYNLILGSTFDIKANLLAKTLGTFSSSYDVRYDGTTIGLTSINGLGTGSFLPAAKAKTIEVNDVVVSSQSITTDEIELDIKFINGTPEAEGWLDYIELFFGGSLRNIPEPLFFRNTSSIGTDNVSRIVLTSTQKGTCLWEVTDHNNVKKLQTSVNNNVLTSSVRTDQLREFVAFDDNEWGKPTLLGKINNQNIRALNAEMIIVSYPPFQSEAERLAEFRRSNDGLNVVVVTTEEIYNEFSSGSQDVMAIRDFVKHIHDQSEINEIDTKYLLLFGDGSYDYKDRISNNTNFVPNYQSINGLREVDSYTTDDYYGITEGVGISISDAITVAVGRLPVNTLNSAGFVVDKIMQYTNNSRYGIWRKQIILVGDDEDNNSYNRGQERNADTIDNYTCQFDIDKIYLDSYDQQDIGGNIEYPEVNKEVNDKFTNGALMISYMGHGGEHGWAHEDILELEDLQGILNHGNMPFVFSSTAKVNLYDDPETTSIGEYMSTNWGAIASLSPTRVVWSIPNEIINVHFISNFVRSDLSQVSLGELTRITKNDSRNSGGSNFRNLTLLGDPAQKLVAPTNLIQTTFINGEDANVFSDTLFAGVTTNIDAEVIDVDGNLMTSFDGNVVIQVLNNVEHQTLGNDPSSIPESFYEWSDTVYFDTIEVMQGQFLFSFEVPTNIDINDTKISYYAYNDQTDASGCESGLISGDKLAGVPKTYLEDFEVKIYPNPLRENGVVEIKGQTEGSFDFLVFDQLGHLVMEKRALRDKEFQINRSGLSSGMYMYSIEGETGTLKKGKLIVY